MMKGSPTILIFLLYCQTEKKKEKKKTEEDKDVTKWLIFARDIWNYMNKTAFKRIFFLSCVPWLNVWTSIVVEKFDIVSLLLLFFRCFFSLSCIGSSFLYGYCSTK